MFKTSLLAVLSFACLNVQAQSVQVKDAWVRATIPQQKATGAFMQISSSKDVKLVEASSTAAGMVEIHEMKMENDVMKMRAVPELAISTGKAVELKPGGIHIMLMDLKAQARVGETLALKLVFEDAQKKRETVEVKAPIKAMSMQGGH